MSRRRPPRPCRRAHGKSSDQVARPNAPRRRARGCNARPHSRLDGFSRLLHEVLPMRKPPPCSRSGTASGFLRGHGIARSQRVGTGDGACCHAGDFATALRGARHQRIAPAHPAQRRNRVTPPHPRRGVPLHPHLAYAALSARSLSISRRPRDVRGGTHGPRALPTRCAGTGTGPGPRSVTTRCCAW